jgi:predicted permease
MKSLLDHLTLAARVLRRSPGFAAIVVLSLALGIGANAAIFSVVNAVLLTPLPYPRPQQLVAIFSRFPNGGFDHFWVSPPEYLELRAQARAFADLGAYSTRAVNVTGRDELLRVEAATATATLFSTLGKPAEIGHGITAAEDVPHAEPVVALGDGLWRRAFAADPRVLGSRITVDGVQRTVVGVMPPGFDLGGQHVELWMPLALGPLDPDDRGNHYLYLIGRLRPEVTVAAARAELAGILERWPHALPNAHTPDPTHHPLIMRPLLEDAVGAARPALRLLWGAVALVLLIACANVANLFLTRAEARQREIAIRSALGAGWRRLLAQFLAESWLLTGLGGAAGLLLALWSLPAIVAFTGESVPRIAGTGIDWRVLLFTLLLALATGLLFSLAPILHLRAGACLASLKEGGQRTTAGAARQRLRSGLVVAEIALAALLAIGGGLLVRSFLALQQVDPGFRPDGLLSFQLSLPRAAYPQPRQAAAFFQSLDERLSGLPDVQSAAAMSGLPPQRDVDANDVVFEGVASDPQGPPHVADFWQFVTRDYFRTMGIPLRAGRFFARSDTVDSTGVVVIDETMAKLFWPGKSPLGQRLRAPGDANPWLTVVGVAADVKEGGLDRKAGTEIYFLEAQASKTVGGRTPRTLNVVLRTAGDPMRLVGEVRREVLALDPALPLAHIAPMRDVVAAAMARPHFLLYLVLAFAGLALVLAAVGTYGVLAYVVQQRRHEIGVRMALGAEVGSVLGLVITQALRLVAGGLLLALLLSIWLGRSMSSLVFGVTPHDPATFAGVALVLTLIALLACFVPARRAARVDPVTTLRGE